MDPIIPARPGVPRLAIVGGGVSGTLLAAQLLHRAGHPLDVVLIENTARLGRGLAYGTNSPEHLLNVPAGRMSALPDQPRHFVAWVERRFSSPMDDEWTFLPRSLYGEYIEATLEEARNSAAPGVVLHRITGEAVGVVEGEGPLCIEVVEQRGRREVRADRVALALGNAPGEGPLAGRLPPSLHAANPWAPGALDGIDPNRPLLVLGSGLTMVDVAVSLRRRGHRAGLIAVSRHGLLPAVHVRPAPGAAPIRPPISLQSADARPRLRSWLRNFRRALAAGPADGDWRALIDSLRSTTPALWAGLDEADRARFLRHLRSYWEVARHRMAPEIGAVVAEMRDQGFLTVLAGRVSRVTADGDGVEVLLSLRGGRGEHRCSVARVINATGPQVDLTGHPAPLLAQLRQAGLARPDALRLGLETATGGALVGSRGVPSTRLYTLGPPLRAAQWEATAVPEIRCQARDLAQLWLQQLDDARLSPPVPTTRVACA